MSRPNKIWYWKERGEWCVKVDGKRHRLGIDKDEATRKYHALKAKQPELVRSDSASGVLDEFLVRVKKKRRPDTYDWYKKHIDSFRATIGDHLLAHELSTQQIQDWIDDANGGDGTKHGMWRAINAALNWAVKFNKIPRNPASAVEKPAQPVRDDFITDHEYQVVLKNTRDQNFKDLCVVAFECGPRPQELFAIQARFVELDKFRVHFPPNFAPKGKRRRFIYLTPNAVRIVKRLVQKYPTGPLFRNTRGEPWNPFSVSCRFTRLKKKVGRKLSLYLFRHAWVTRKLVAGVESTILKDLAGHVDTQMINRVYGHAAENWHFMSEQANRDQRVLIAPSGPSEKKSARGGKTKGTKAGQRR